MTQEEIKSCTEQELWIRYKKEHDPVIRDHFVKQYSPLVKYVAGKISIGLPQHVEFDDLVGYGVFGLFDAISKYDPAKQVKFNTYAVTRIRGAIFDELRSIDWVPRSIRQKSREIENSLRNLELTLGRAATEKELANELGLTMKELDSTLQKVSGTTLLSLNDLWHTGEEGGSVSIGESITAPTTMHPDVIVEKQEIRKVVASAIQELPEKEKKVLILYYYEDLTLKEIGEVLEVTESRISQMHTKAILRLRTKLTNIRKGIM